MAFLAVLREGLETAVFLLAAFEDSTDPRPPGIGALLGLAVAVAIGVGLYRGGAEARPGALLPRHGRGARDRRRRPGGLVAARRGRGGLDRRRPAAGLRSLVADRRPGTGDRLAADRHARAAAASDRARGHRLGALRGADADLRLPPDRVRPQVRAATAGFAWSPRRSCSLVGVLARRRERGATAAASGPAQARAT